MNETKYGICFDQLKEFPLQKTLGEQEIMWKYLGLPYIGLMICGDFFQEKVLGVEEFGASHQGAILAEVVYRVLEEFDLTQKVSNYCLTIFLYQSSMYNIFKIF